MNKTRHLFLVLCLLYSWSAQASVFHWRIADRVTVPNGIVIHKNFEFMNQSAKFENKYWRCEISAPDGFKIKETGGYQEGVTITCTLKKDSKVKVTAYGACSRFMKNGEAENSGTSVTVFYDKEYSLTVACSENAFKY